MNSHSCCYVCVKCGIETPFQCPTPSLKRVPNEGCEEHHDPKLRKKTGFVFPVPNPIPIPMPLLPHTQPNPCLTVRTPRIWVCHSCHGLNVARETRVSKTTNACKFIQMQHAVLHDIVKFELNESLKRWIEYEKKSGRSQCDGQNLMPDAV